MNWFFMALKKYATFSGRSQRSEYWYFIFFYFLIIFACTALDTVIENKNKEEGIGLFAGLAGLALLLPLFAVTTRRFHDIGKSGWWQLIYLVPFIGTLILLVFTLRDSADETNEYGPNPKYADSWVR